MLGLLSQIAERLDDPSPVVRAEATTVLARWADEVGEETLEMFLDREKEKQLGG
jgi:hypothetical protein